MRFFAFGDDGLLGDDLLHQLVNVSAESINTVLGAEIE